MLCRNVYDSWWEQPFCDNRHTAKPAAFPARCPHRTHPANTKQLLGIAVEVGMDGGRVLLTAHPHSGRAMRSRKSP